MFGLISHGFLSNLKEIVPNLSHILFFKDWIHEYFLGIPYISPENGNQTEDDNNTEKSMLELIKRTVIFIRFKKV